MDVLPGSEGGGELFQHSQLPPIRLPLDYSMHTRHRTVLAKQVKVRQEPASSDQTAVRLAKPVRQVIGPPAPVKPHETTAAELFTPSEVTTVAWNHASRQYCTYLLSLPHCRAPRASFCSYSSLTVCPSLDLLPPPLESPWKWRAGQLLVQHRHLRATRKQLPQTPRDTALCTMFQRGSLGN